MILTIQPNQHQWIHEYRFQSRGNMYYKFSYSSKRTRIFHRVVNTLPQIDGLLLDSAYWNTLVHTGRNNQYNKWLSIEARQQYLDIWKDQDEGSPSSFQSRVLWKKVSPYTLHMASDKSVVYFGWLRKCFMNFECLTNNEEALNLSSWNVDQETE